MKIKYRWIERCPFCNYRIHTDSEGDYVECPKCHNILA